MGGFLGIVFFKTFFPSFDSEQEYPSGLHTAGHFSSFPVPRMCLKGSYSSAGRGAVVSSSTEVIPERWQVFFVCSVSTSKTSGLAELAISPYMMLFLLTEKNCVGTKFHKFCVGCLTEGKTLFKVEVFLHNVLPNPCLAKHQITCLCHLAWLIH